MPLPYTRATLSPDGRIAAATIETRMTPATVRAEVGVVFWDLEADREIARLGDLPASSEPRSLAFSPDGATLAVGREDGSVELWDAATRTLRRTIREHTDAYSAMYLEFSADGS